MPRLDDDDDLSDDEAPDAADVGDSADDDVDTLDCPRCGAAVYEEAERCPRCGHYISHNGAGRRFPRWVVVTVALCLALVLLWQC